MRSAGWRPSATITRTSSATCAGARGQVSSGAVLANDRDNAEKCAHMQRL